VRRNPTTFFSILFHYQIVQEPANILFVTEVTKHTFYDQKTKLRTILGMFRELVSLHEYHPCG